MNKKINAEKVLFFDRERTLGNSSSIKEDVMIIFTHDGHRHSPNGKLSLNITHTRTPLGFYVRHAPNPEDRGFGEYKV